VTNQTGTLALKSAVARATASATPISLPSAESHWYGYNQYMCWPGAMSEDCRICTAALEPAA